jgi:hypothetical protein
MNQTPFHYILAVRLPNRKWLGIAGTNSGGCLAGSETVFDYYGLKGQAHWSNIEDQKNYAGRAPDFRAVELSEAEQSLFWYKRTLAQGCYESLAHFLDTFPNAAKYENELKEIKA